MNSPKYQRCTRCAHNFPLIPGVECYTGYTCDPTGKILSCRGHQVIEYTCADCGYVGTSNHPDLRAKLQASVRRSA